MKRNVRKEHPVPAAAFQPFDAERFPRLTRRKPAAILEI